MAQDSYSLSGSESSDLREDEEGWDDVEADEEETLEVICLLDDRVFPDVKSMLVHCKEKYEFDFLAIRQRLQLDFIGCVKLINYIRQRVHAGQPVSNDISSADIEDDQFLKPVLDDDAVIVGLDDLPDVVPEGAALASAEGGQGPELVNDLLKRNTELEEALVKLNTQFENYRAAVQRTLDERWGAEDSKAGDVPAAESSGAAAAAASEGDVKRLAKVDEKPVDDSKYYWESYAGNDIHETMLKDTVRTDAYRDFIYNNKQLFAGKTVLDIGCGTGILSMFCARAGAAKVLAVDASEIIEKARENVFHNGLGSIITCVKGRIEEVTLPVPSVDIIVSEWMGYCLLYEAMLPSVLWARDRYLKPDGLLVPSHTNIWVAPIADPEYVADNVSFWLDVYGFDMHAMQRGIYDEARVIHQPTEGLAGPGAAVQLLDLYTTKPEDLSFSARWSSVLSQDIDALDGFLIWFDMFFSPTRDDHATIVELAAKAEEWAKVKQDRVAFTTGPYGKETHWRQGLLLTKPGARPSALKTDEKVEGEITFSVPEDNARALIIKNTWLSTGLEKEESQSWQVR